MPSLMHEALVALFRNRPLLAPEVLQEALDVELPPFTEATIGAANLTEVTPTEYRADLVVLLRDGEPVLAIVVEVQLDRDSDKRYVWPAWGPLRNSWRVSRRTSFRLQGALTRAWPSHVSVKATQKAERGTIETPNCF